MPLTNKNFLNGKSGVAAFGVREDFLVRQVLEQQRTYFEF